MNALYWVDLGRNVGRIFKTALLGCVLLIVVLFAFISTGSVDVHADSVFNLQSLINANAANGVPTVINQNYIGPWLDGTNLLQYQQANCSGWLGNAGLGNANDSISFIVNPPNGPYTGSYAAECSLLSGTSGFAGVNTIEPVMTCTPDTTYTISVVVEGDSTSVGDPVCINVLNAGGGFVAGTVEGSLTNNWQTLTYTFNSSANSNIQNQIYFKIYDYNCIAPKNLYIGAIQVQQGSTATAWVSGVPGYDYVLNIPSGTTLIGNGYTMSDLEFNINNSSNVNISGLNINGTVNPYSNFNQFPTFNIQGNCSNIVLDNSRISYSRTQSAIWFLDAGNVSNVTIGNNIVTETDGQGLYTQSCQPSSCTVKNFTMINDTCAYIGMYGTSNSPYTCAYQMENNPPLFSNMSFINCMAEYTYAEGFYAEWPTDVTNPIQFINCNAHDNGLVGPSHGYDLSTSVYMNNCTMSNDNWGCVIYAPCSAYNSTIVNCMDYNNTAYGIDIGMTENPGVWFTIINETSIEPSGTVPIAYPEITNIIIQNKTSQTPAPTPSPAPDNVSYTYNLAQGYNLISVPVSVSNDSVAGFFGNANSSVGYIWGWDASAVNWTFYSPDANAWPYQDGYDTLTSLTAGSGYWVYMNSPATFTVNGIASTQPTLHSGYNFAGIIGVNASTPAATFSSAQCVWGWDASTGNWTFYSSNANAWPYLDGYEKLTTIQPGSGYWVDV
jgi:hypothetical protein